MHVSGKEARYREFSYHRNLLEIFEGREQSPAHSRIRESQELLDMIYGHAVETFELYPKLSIQWAKVGLSSNISGHFTVVKTRQPTPDEYDLGSLLVLSVYVTNDTQPVNFEVFVHKDTVLLYEY